jgi:hypothetical protein
MLLVPGKSRFTDAYLPKAEVPGLLPSCSLFAAASEPPLVPMMQATWQSGHSLAQTVYACLYLHMPERTAPNAILHAYCKMARSTCNLVRTLVCVADIHEVGETGSVILEQSHERFEWMNLVPDARRFCHGQNWVAPCACETGRGQLLRRNKFRFGFLKKVVYASCFASILLLCPCVCPISPTMPSQSIQRRMTRKGSPGFFGCTTDHQSSHALMKRGIQRNQSVAHWM